MHFFLSIFCSARSSFENTATVIPWGCAVIAQAIPDRPAASVATIVCSALGVLALWLRLKYSDRTQVRMSHEAELIKSLEAANKAVAKTEAQSGVLLEALRKLGIDPTPGGATHDGQANSCDAGSGSPPPAHGRGKQGVNRQGDGPGAGNGDSDRTEEPVNRAGFGRFAERLEPRSGA